MEDVEQGWNTTGGIHTDQVGPFVQVKRVKKWAKGHKKWQKEAKMGLNRPNRLNRPPMSYISMEQVGT